MENSSHVVEKLNIVTEFGQMLIECAESANFFRVLLHLKNLGPSAIDAEIRSLDTMLPGNDTDNEGNRLLLHHFLCALEQGLSKKQNFELIQSYLALFLKIHAEYIMKDKKLQAQCMQISKLLGEMWGEFELKFHSSLCVINYLRSIVT